MVEVGLGKVCLKFVDYLSLLFDMWWAGNKNHIKTVFIGGMNPV